MATYLHLELELVHAGRRVERLKAIKQAPGVRPAQNLGRDHVRKSIVDAEPQKIRTALLIEDAEVIIVGEGQEGSYELAASDGSPGFEAGQADRAQAEQLPPGLLLGAPASLANQSVVAQLPAFGCKALEGDGLDMRDGEALADVSTRFRGEGSDVMLALFVDDMITGSAAGRI